MARYAHGWFQLGYEADMAAALTPVSLGARRLLVVRQQHALRAFDADCPHRGANLAHGGTLDGEAIVCPFHGYRIALGCRGGEPLAVREYRLHIVQGLVFVRLSDHCDFALEAELARLADSHRFVHACTVAVAAAPELVIENGVDRRHFDSVHGVATDDFAVSGGAGAALAVRSVFEIPVMPRERALHAGATRPVPYEASYFSPGVVLVRLGGAAPYAALTAVTDHRGDGSCTLRLTLIVPNDVDRELLEILCRHSIRGIEDDRRIWENVVAPARPQLLPSDQPVLAFQHFCRQFE